MSNKMSCLLLLLFVDRSGALTLCSSKGRTIMTTLLIGAALTPNVTVKKKSTFKNCVSECVEQYLKTARLVQQLTSTFGFGLKVEPHVCQLTFSVFNVDC